MPTLFLHFFLFLITTSLTNLIPIVHSNCIEAQKQSLLHFKESLLFNSSSSSKLITWNSRTDCCSWLGVTCSTNGNVVGLDLSRESISCSIDGSSNLFQLQNLQSLNLAYNDFKFSSIPSAIRKLANLRYLNLSSAYFSRHIPIEVARLTRLVTLDLSKSDHFLGGNPNLRMLFQNLTELTELYFESVDLSTPESDWCEAVSSSLPNLRVLSLSDCGLRGPICESLAKLQSLYDIDLSYNYFNSSVPKAFANLSNLTYLSLSFSELVGTFPKEIFQIPSLQTIDLSNNVDLHGSFPEFSNNGSLRSLIVDSTSFSGDLPNSVGNLKMLSTIYLSNCSFTGSLPKSIENLTQLVELVIANMSSSLDIFGNQIQGKIPNWILSLKSLTYLDLSGNSLVAIEAPLLNSSSVLSSLDLSGNQIQGEIPNWIFSLKSLTYLDLSGNSFVTLETPLPNSTSILSYLDLSGNQIQGKISNWILSLKSLTYLDLSGNSFVAIEAHLLNSSSVLSSLDLSRNQIQGEVPNWIFNLKSLTHLDLSGNSFVTLEAHLLNSSFVLSYLDLSRNQIQGEIPNWIFSLKSLTYLHLSGNSFVAIEAHPPNSTSVLYSLLLSGNQIQGEIPNWIFSLKSLEVLDLSCNSFVTVEPPLPNSTSALFSLDLYSNKLEDIPSSYSFLQLGSLVLSSNKLTTFPDFLRNQSTLGTLDLSDNQIQGQIPNWTWKLGSFIYLNLSCNSFETLEAPPTNSTYDVEKLDLHSNRLQGQIPLFLSGPYIDYSGNNFNSTIPTDIGVVNAWAYLSLSSNNLHGPIPNSICKASGLVLDLSNNSLSGDIPQCLTRVPLLGRTVLDLSRNKLTGTIPDQFQKDCELETLDLSRNQIQGQFPKSLVHCSRLVVLNLGNNYITDTFPCSLMSISTLHVLVLQSNKFYGSIGCPRTNDTWSVLQVIDLAHNSFGGDIAGRMFMNWHAMISKENGSSTNLEFHHRSNLYVYDRNPYMVPEVYYRDTITTIIKGTELDVVKILTIFTLVDFSNNKLNGSIPEEIGELKALYALNLSNNAFTGGIPSSFGQMQQLESLDLSNNQLNGTIPQQMVNLSFLAVLDLSDNQLVGRIPTGTQFSTFPSTSFEGNKGLWGPPLTRDALLPPPTPNGSSSPLNSGNEIDWDIISAEIGFTCGFGLAVGSLLFCKRWRKWYYRAMRGVLFKIFPQLEHKFGVHRRHVYINTRR